MLPQAALLALAAFLFKGVRADLAVYSDGALAAGWENWSWSSTINFAATDVYEGTSSINTVSTAYAGLSFYLEGTGFGSGYAGLRFDIAGASPDVSLYFTSNADNVNSASIPLSAFAPGGVKAGAFTSVLIDFSNLPGSGVPLATDTWDRITWQSGGNGATYWIDNIELVTEIVITPKFLSAEPLANNIVAVTTQGAVDFSTVSVALNNATAAVSSKTTYSPPDTPAKTITYLTLKTALAPGLLNITAGGASYTYTLPATEYGSITTGVQTPISPLIYGVNFPDQGSYLTDLGITLSRWGGNAVTAYNPFGQFTNAGNDWYFENRVADPPDADAWNGWVAAGGSKSLLTIPALDWVSKDATSYSYPKSVYPSQQSYDPYNADAGDGLFPNGSYITPAPPQTRAYTPWNTTLAKTWLTGLKNKPDIVTVDNEIEISSNTHADMQQTPLDYDELLARVVNTATAAKEALPSVAVAAPSTCAWWFYWTTEVGYTDNAAHNNIDWLPWFLTQMKAAEKTAGKRLLDYLDIHYYYAPDTSANDAAAKALRLRMTRSLWDPSYVDESWIGSSPQNHQPNPTAVWLVPRMKALIAQNYPGTKLSISEWSSTADTDITGGLVAVDALGIYGRYGVDAATYWGTVDEQGPIGLAFWLYRGYGKYFGSNSVQVNLAKTNENVLGYYAAIQGGKISLVIANKDVVPIGLNIANIPAGKYLLRHFGGEAGVYKWQTNITIAASSYFVVPSYTAVFLLQQ